jgi:hypothetical protein
MQLRFIDAPGSGVAPVAEAERHECSCSWCGFRGGPDLRRYAEEDGAPAVACGPCFAARHASSADPAMFALAWLPEIAQTDLAHLMRVVAVLLKRHPAAKVAAAERTRAQPPVHAVRERALEVVRRLRLRVEETGSVLAGVDATGDIGGLLQAMEPGLRGVLVEGLRLVPLAFETSEVEGWLNEESSLNGYGYDLLRRNDWFAGDIELKSDAVDALHANEEMAPLRIKATEQKAGAAAGEDSFGDDPFGGKDK